MAELGKRAGTEATAEKIGRRLNESSGNGGTHVTESWMTAANALDDL